MTSQRGILVSTPVVAKSGRLRVEGSPFDPQELRFWLLFWDKLNFPLLDSFPIEPGPDGEFLQSEAILKREFVKDACIILHDEVSEDLPQEQFQYHFLRAFRALDTAEPGIWSIATGDRSLILDADQGGDGRGVLFELHRALPVPHKDVPLDDLLEFKAKRFDELIALRHHLEQVYQKIISAPDSSMALVSEFEAVDAALSDYLKVARQGIIKKWILASVEAELQILPAINTSVVAFVAGLPLAQSLLAGAAAGISVKTASGLKDLHRLQGTPWRYVSRYSNELFHEKF